MRASNPNPSPKYYYYSTATTACGELLGDEGVYYRAALLDARARLAGAIVQGGDVVPR